MHLWHARNKQIVFWFFFQVKFLVISGLWYISTPSIKEKPKGMKAINEQNILIRLLY